MKKGIQISILISILFLVVYYGIIRKGFSYFTGFGTPYSYFEAEKATHDSVLILYEQELTHPFFNVNTDSLQLSYGFESKYGGIEVSGFIIQSYNSIIKKELHRRLGKRWNEYLFKNDSLQMKNGLEIVRPPGWNKNSKVKK